MKIGEIVTNRTEHTIEAKQVKLELSSRNEVILHSPLGGNVRFADLFKSMGVVGHIIDINISVKEVNDND
jgi:hypothetical protein|nr:MAG TPA: hypothetical protein [Caudoviricetes sp.]